MKVFLNVLFIILSLTASSLYLIHVVDSEGITIVTPSEVQLETLNEAVVNMPLDEAEYNIHCSTLEKLMFVKEAVTLADGTYLVSEENTLKRLKYYSSRGVVKVLVK